MPAVNPIMQVSSDTFKVGDFFDVSHLTRTDARLITNDIRASIVSSFGAVIQADGIILYRRNQYDTLSESAVRKVFRKYDFMEWQIKSEESIYGVKIVILYVDVAINTKLIENIMFVCGWSRTCISEPETIYDTPVRVICFEPTKQPITNEYESIQDSESLLH